MSLRAQGWSIPRAASECGFSSRSGSNIEGLPANGDASRLLRAEKTIPDRPTPFELLCPEAKAALEDRTGALWCRRYWGVDLNGWQLQFWTLMEDAWDSPDREYELLNAPPGGGKTSVMIYFASKLIAKDRAVRTLFMSKASNLAEKTTRKLKGGLERTVPVEGAVATMSSDFGRFKPRAGGEVWRAGEFVVEQMDGAPVEEKEPTVGAFGFDSGWLGNRIDALFGDDLDNTRSIRNFDVVAANREIFDGELEPRLERGGMFVLAQQRLGPFDFSAHVKSKMVMPDSDDGEGDLTEPQYRTTVFKAHYDELCKGSATHRIDAPCWPDGCLLDPRNLSWRDIRKAMNNPDKFRVVYQQEDVAESEALVQRIWVDGGRDHDGMDYIGCWDNQRSTWEIPQGLAGTQFGVVTVDPSPTRYWSNQAWLIAAGSEQRYLLDIERKRMEAPDFLDWSITLNDWTGLAEDWRKHYLRAGSRLTHLIVERNAAQRFMLQYDHFHRWRSKWGIQVIAHDTSRNKADEDYGVQMLGPRWRDGQVRLPGKGQDARLASLKLVEEVVRYPHSPTDDCVMAQWFLEHNLSTLNKRLNNAPKKMWRPSWAPTRMAGV